MKRQVVVVGAGPSGSTCAHFLSKSGIQVLLADKVKFPREKPCGDAQLRECHPLLREMGIYEALKKQTNVLAGVAISAPDGGYRCFYSPAQEIFCTPRLIVDDIIRCSALREGAEFMENYTATELLLKQGRVVGVRGIRNGKTLDIHSEAVIVADGARSRLARQLGSRRSDPDNLFFGARGYFEHVTGMTDVIEFFYPDPMFFPAGYIWIFPLSKDRANVGVFITQHALKKSGISLKGFIPWFRENSEIGKTRLGKARPSGPFRGAMLPTFETAHVNNTPGALVIGDAGSLIDALFGSGFHYAMKSGRLAAEVIQEAFGRGDVSGIVSGYNRGIGAQMAPEFSRYRKIRERLFTNPEDLNAFISAVSSVVNSDLHGKGLNETINLYLGRCKAALLLS